MPNLKNEAVDCVPYIRAKLTRLPFPNKTETSTSEIFALIYSNLCGPMKTESLGSGLYFATFIDDYSRKVFSYFIRFII